jgi:hypothetical protein
MKALFRLREGRQGLGALGIRKHSDEQEEKSRLVCMPTMAGVDFPALFVGHRGEPVFERRPKVAREAAIPHTGREIDIAQDAEPLCPATRFRDGYRPYYR